MSTTTTTTDRTCESSMYYLETRISPHGARSIVGGQSPDGRPLVEYRTADAAKAAIPACQREMGDTATDFKGKPMLREVNVCRTEDLRAPGYSHYMRLP